MTISLKYYAKGLGFLPGMSPEAFQFPGGEWHLRNIPGMDHVRKQGPLIAVADVRGADPNDLVQAALWADIAHQKGDEFVLLIPYLPAARADRGMPFGARVYAKLIDSMEASKVIVLDPHSLAGVQVNEQSLFFVSQLDIIEHALTEELDVLEPLVYDALICPDAGAQQRVGQTAQRLGLDVYSASKHRDFETGVITEIKMDEPLPKSGHYLVVDDICDGGGTFMGLAQATGLSHDHLDLWVTHGIFSGNAPALRECYGNIMTTDSHPGAHREGVDALVYPVLPYMERVINQ